MDYGASAPWLHNCFVQCDLEGEEQELGAGEVILNNFVTCVTAIRREETIYLGKMEVKLDR